MGEINWKLKYEALKLKFMNSMDMAYRIGYEEGAKDAQMEAMAQQQQAADQAAQAQQNGFGNEEDPNQDSEQDGEQPEVDSAGIPGKGDNTAPPPGIETGEEDPNAPPVEGSELDNHIGELEQMIVGKTEVSVDDLKKSLANIKRFKEARDLHKSMQAIKSISKSLKKSGKIDFKSIKAPKVKPVFQIGKQAEKNISNKDKAALSMQEKIVSDIMKSWEEQEIKAAEKISTIAAIEGLTKKE